MTRIRVTELIEERICTLLNKDDICLEYRGNTINYGQLFKNVEKIAKHLQNNGVRKSSIVVFYLDKSIDFCIALLAVNKLDAVVMPVYVQTGVQSLINIVEKYEADYMVTSSELYNNVGSKVVEGTSLKKVMMVKDADLHILKEQKVQEEKEMLIHSDCRFLLLSSGTTSLPKAIMLSNENVISNIASISQYLKLQRKDRIILYKNINHSSTLIGELLVGLYNGCFIYLNHVLPSGKFLVQVIEDKKITVFFTVPSVLLDVFQKKNVIKLESIRLVNFYGDKFIDNIIHTVECFRKIRFIYSYGLTEASPRVSYIQSEDMLLKPGSSGKPIENVEISIDVREELVLDGNRGEICVRGPNVMLGYYKDEILTQEKLKDGYLHTGDIGYLDKDGYLYVVGRKDNMFIKNGKNIYPEEIEKAIYELYDTAEKVLVTGEQNNGKTKIIGSIVWKENKIVAQTEVYRELNKVLDSYKIPDLLQYTNEIQVTASGKVKRIKN